MKTKKILVRSVLVLVALAALCACAWCVWYIIQYYQGQSFGDRIRTNAPDATGSFQLERVKIPVDFDELQAMNPDIYAWVTIPDTDISYAVLQRAGEEEYYSKHSENGAYYSGGSIFSQDYNQKDFSDPMTVLYGHNLRNGRMFAQLNDFSDAEVFEAHRYIYVYLPDRMLVYEIFAAYPHSNEHLLLCHDFADADNFTAYFDGVQAQKSLQSNFRTDAWPEPGDRVLTLSTCFRGAITTNATSCRASSWRRPTPNNCIRKGKPGRANALPGFRVRKISRAGRFPDAPCFRWQCHESAI